MYYICIEDNKIVSVLDYQPNVPASVRVVEITDEQNQSILNRTHYFDVSSNSVKTVSAEQSQLNLQAKSALEKQQFLDSTDWKVMRHIRQKALGIETTLTEEEYIALEQERQIAATTMVKPPNPPQSA